MPVSDIADLAMAGSAIIAAAVAVIALFLAKAQIRAANEISVQDAYLEYHRLAIQYPDFANPDYEAIRRTPRLETQYMWFVLSMLVCVERVLLTYRSTESWEAAIGDDFEMHRAYLTSEAFEPLLGNFDDELRVRLVRFRATCPTPG